MNTIRVRLFVVYSLLIILLILIFMGSYYSTTYAGILKSAEEFIINQSGYMSSLLDSEIRSMDDAALRLIYSGTMREKFYKELDNVNDIETVYASRELVDLIYAVAGPDLPFLQVYLLNSDGRCFYTGIYTKYEHISGQSMSEIPGMQASLNANGRRCIIGPHEDYFGNTDQTVFSVCRSFAYSLSNDVDSVVEIQKSYSDIESIISPYLDKGSVFIIGRNGSLLNTVDGTGASLWEEMQPQIDVGTLSESGIVRFKIDGEDYIASYTASDYTDFIVLYAMDMPNFLPMFNGFTDDMIQLGVLMLVVMLVVSFFVARGLTRPIRHMYEYVSGYNLDSPVLLPSRQSRHPNELKQLEYAFSQMSQRLQSSLDDIVTLRSYEMEARLLAYQSQINPHFLYNTLSMLAVEARHGNVGEVEHMITDLSNMLRYAMADEKMTATIGGELEYTLSYITLMNRRFGRTVNFDLNVPPCLYGVNCPRLIIQPLVENTIKYGGRDDTHWDLSITGTCCDDRFSLIVQDSGPGFPDEVLEYINALKYAEGLDAAPVDKMVGIGLKNIKLRILLYYKGAGDMRIENTPSGGRVTITGVLCEATPNGGKNV